MRLVALALVACVLCLAQSGQRTGSIAGSVVDSVTQAPIYKARVRLMPMGMQSQSGSPSMPPAPASTVSDASGSFRFENLAPGIYVVLAHHNLYPFSDQGPKTEQVQVKDAEAARMKLGLDPGAVISGRVFDEEGDPIPGCIVRAQSAAGRLPGSLGDVMPPSNEQGEYRLWGIPAGKYHLTAMCGQAVFEPRPLSADPLKPPSMAYPMQFYPGTADIAAAQVLELQPGTQKESTDFRMRPARVYTLSGRVIPASGQPSQAARWELIPRGGISGFGRKGGATDAATGAFRISHVFAGSYDLVAVLQRLNSPEVSAGGRQSVEVTDASLQVNLPLQNTVNITGTVTVETDQPFPMQAMQLQFMPEPMTGLLGNLAGSPVNSDGSFEVKGVLPGRSRLMIYGPNIFLKSVELGGRSLPVGTFDLPNGSSGPLRLVVSTRVASVEGTGRPNQGYRIVQDSDPSRILVMSADTKGHFNLSGLAPGKYRIFEDSSLDDPAKAQEFTAGEGGKISLDLTREAR